MKKATGIKFAALLMLFMGITVFSNSNAQTTTWKFDAADNSGWMIQVKTIGSEQAVSEVNLGKKGDAAWTKTEIHHMDEYETYIRVKSKTSGRVYELEFDWYEGKAIMTKPDGVKVTYWLRKS